MVAAWKELGGIPLVVVGVGPLSGSMAGSGAGRTGTDGTVHSAPTPDGAFARGGGRLGTESSVPIFPIGRQTREKVLELMREARVLIVPSECYENGPLTVLEAFACGLPVIASNLGSMAEIVDHERTGLLFEPGNAADLARKVRWAFEHPEAVDAMRAAARREFEEKYTAERNYGMLMAIYETAIANRKRGRRAAS